MFDFDRPNIPYKPYVKQTYNKIYLPFVPSADVNYIYLFSLYRIADRYDDSKIKSYVSYKSHNDLLRKINEDKKIMSYSTLSRVLQNNEYNAFFEVLEDDIDKSIFLFNDVRRLIEQKKGFVILFPDTYKLLIQQNDNLLAKYTIYLKYMCGKCGGHTDITADQFLSAFGYSINSNNTKDKISGFNRLLEEKRIVKIDRNRLEDGKRRNTYTFIDK